MTIFGVVPPVFEHTHTVTTVVVVIQIQVHCIQAKILRIEWKSSVGPVMNHVVVLDAPYRYFSPSSDALDFFFWHLISPDKAKIYLQGR